MGENHKNVPQPRADIDHPESPLRRRNGQQAACEPCRKAKLRCDHASPVCSRCRKRKNKNPNQCIILAAPTTNSKRTIAITSKVPSVVLAQVSEPASGVEIRHLAPPHENKLSYESSSGFLGPTSFSGTVQTENLPEEPKVVSDSKRDIEMEKSVQLATQVLMQLPGEETCYNLLDWYLEDLVVVGAHKLSRRLTLKALWTSYGHLLRGERSRGNLEIMAREILRNGRIPLKSIDDPMEWIASFSGRNTRWEVIGLLFIAFDYTLLSCPNACVLLGIRGEDVNTHIAEMKTCIEACIELCKDSLNSVVCNLLYWNVLLETVLNGDSSEFVPETSGKHVPS